MQCLFFTEKKEEPEYPRKLPLWLNLQRGKPLLIAVPKGIISALFTGLLVYFICHSISSKKSLVIKLNGDHTKDNIALSFNVLMAVISKSHNY